MKRITIATVLALTLAGCGHVTSDAEDAWAACRGVINPNIRDSCMANYVSTAQAGRDAQWSAIGAGMLSGGGYRSYQRPVTAVCQRSGVVTICN